MSVRPKNVEKLIVDSCLLLLSLCLLLFILVSLNDHMDKPQDGGHHKLGLGSRLARHLKKKKVKAKKTMTSPDTDDQGTRDPIQQRCCCWQNCQRRCCCPYSSGSTYGTWYPSPPSAPPFVASPSKTRTYPPPSLESFILFFETAFP
jgi:hypothetical protein